MSSCSSVYVSAPEEFCPFTFMRSMPRKDGHCHSFHIPSTICSSTTLCDDDLSIALSYLYKIEPLRWGDLIIFDSIHDGTSNDGIVIFNGCSLLYLDYTYCNTGALPQCFTVGSNGVPFDYWMHIDCSCTGHGILNTCLVWYPYDSEVLIPNIKYEKCENIYILYTCDENIKIIYDLGEDPSKKLSFMDLCNYTVNFVNALRTNQPLSFSSYTFSDFEFPATLFLID